MTQSEDSPAGPGPVLIMRGSFAVYRAPDGGMHLSYRPETAEEDTHMHLPAGLITLGQQMSEGANPLKIARELMNFRRAATKPS